MKETLIIVPAYNEEKRIRRTLNEYAKTGFDILVIFDGTDNTDKVVRECMKEYRNIFLIKFNRRLGKGGAVREGFKWAIKEGYKYIILADADASTTSHFLKLIEKKLREGNDVIYTIRTLCNYGILRKFLSKLYLLLNWIILPELIGIKDLQSGYKGFSKKFVKMALKRFIITGFSFDSNLLILATRYKMKIGYIKILWKHEKESSKITGKLMRISLGMFLSLFKLRIFFSPLRRFLYTGFIRTLDEKLKRILR